MSKVLVALALALAIGGCNVTPQQAAALTCALAADGATVVAIYAPGAAPPKATASSQVACNAASQVGSILGSAK